MPSARFHLLPRRVAAIALLALLGACTGEPVGWTADQQQICSPPPPFREVAPADAYQQAVARDECIHNWSYRLARSEDDAEAVVGAVIGACRTSIDRSATMVAAGDPEAERFYLAEFERASRERALFRVVQARAGRCSLEPRAIEAGALATPPNQANEAG
ncbi:MAG: hypothetical protein ACK4SZ_00225 [Allosphingosinicella sp.]|uniref:hypothetical protein n=1 Tax=Allosphingosinicella sp. TaxID=2823234 RepID=UPI0039582932